MARKRMTAETAPTLAADRSADVKGLVIFVDIRRFTGWSDTPEVFSNLDIFVGGFNALLRKHFPEPLFLKPLGDGAMIVRELKANKDPAGLLGKTLETIQAANQGFASFCRAFERKVGHETSLDLGWGVVWGKLRKIENDYVGSNVNKSARLCNEARPFGLVIDRFDFPDIPQSAPFRFFPQVRKLSGLQEVAVWVTPEIKEGFLPREQIRERPEVHVAGTCVMRTGKGVRLLIARRGEQRALLPGKYEGCGGQLAEGETFEEGVARHFRKEMGIEVKVLSDLHCFYVIREANEPVIPGIRFLCEQVDDKTPSSLRHSEVKWVSESEFRAIPADEFVGGLKDEVLKLLTAYKQR